MAGICKLHYQNITNLNQAPTAISFSSAMHSIMPVDERGNALADAMLWSDSRSGDIAQTIRKSTQGEDIYQHTGTAIYAMSPLCKLIWLRENSIELFNSAHKFISVKEYVWFKLFGVFEVDYSIASAMGLFDVLELKWYDKACALAGVDVSRLSTPVNTNHKRMLPLQIFCLALVPKQLSLLAPAMAAVPTLAAMRYAMVLVRLLLAPAAP
jgi:gluconokinase